LRRKKAQTLRIAHALCAPGRCDIFPNVPPDVYAEKVVNIFHRIRTAVCDGDDTVPLKVRRPQPPPRPIAPRPTAHNGSRPGFVQL
jgi:hypothetical protein